MKKFLLFAVAALLCGTLAAQEVEWPWDENECYKIAVNELKSKDNTRVQDAINHLEKLTTINSKEYKDIPEKALKQLKAIGQKPGIDNPIPRLLETYNSIKDCGLQKDGKSRWYIVCKDNNWQIVNAQGNALSQESYDKIIAKVEVDLGESNLSEDQIFEMMKSGQFDDPAGQFIVKKNGKKALMGEDFKLLTTFCYDFITSRGDYKDGHYYSVKKDGMTGVISEEGALMVPTRYKTCKLGLPLFNCFVMEKTSGNYCIYLTNEEKEMGDFANVESANNAVISVTNDKNTKNATWAIISPIDGSVSDYVFKQNLDEISKKFIINGKKFTFDTPFYYGKALIRLFNKHDEIEGNVYIMDSHGKVVQETEYSYAYFSFPASGDTKDCRIAVTKDYALGFVDHNYNLVIPCRYYNATNFFVDKNLASKPVALVKEGEGKEIKLIDLNGNTLRTFSDNDSLPASLKDIEWLEEMAEAIEAVEPIEESESIDEYGKTAY